MTQPQLPDTDVQRGRQQATLGIGLVVAAAIGLSAFESIVSGRLVFTGIARAVLILLIGILAFRGRRWAAWLFGFFAIAGAAAGVIGLAGTKFSSAGIVLFAPVIAASAAGFALIFFSPPARAFLRRQQAMAPQSLLPPRPAPPNG
jgi:peptidoglycan/LPS O-acetylase OafA/YrhL